MRSHPSFIIVLLTLAIVLAPSPLSGQPAPPLAAGAAPAIRFSGEITVVWRSGFGLPVYDPSYRVARPVEQLLLGFDGRLRRCSGVAGVRSVEIAAESSGITAAGAGFVIAWPWRRGATPDLWAWCE
jgi:hypothetical protein